MSLWILVIILVVILVLWWALRRNVKATEETAHKSAEVLPVAEEVEIKATHVADDLTMIEGIGPKIAAVLKEAGINTFAQLAREDTDHLKSILEGANLRLADPTSWPEQARLAAQGDEEGLKALQGQLKGGRVVK